MQFEKKNRKLSNLDRIKKKYLSSIKFFFYANGDVDGLKATAQGAHTTHDLKIYQNEQTGTVKQLIHHSKEDILLENIMF